MVDDDIDIYDSNEALSEDEPVVRERKGEARRRYDRLIDERRLKQQLEDDISYW